MGWMELVGAALSGGLVTELVRFLDRRRKRTAEPDDKTERVVTEALKIVTRIEHALEPDNVLAGAAPMPEHIRRLAGILAKQAQLLPDQAARDALLLTCMLLGEEGLIAGFGTAYHEGTYERWDVALMIIRRARAILSASFRGDPVPDFDDDMKALVLIWIEASEIVDEVRAEQS